MCPICMCAPRPRGWMATWGGWLAGLGRTTWDTFMPQLLNIGTAQCRRVVSPTCGEAVFCRWRRYHAFPCEGAAQPVSAWVWANEECRCGHVGNYKRVPTKQYLRRSRYKRVSSKITKAGLMHEHSRQTAHATSLPATPPPPPATHITTAAPTHSILMPTNHATSRWQCW